MPSNPAPIVNHPAGTSGQQGEIFSRSPADAEGHARVHLRGNFNGAGKTISGRIKMAVDVNLGYVTVDNFTITSTGSGSIAYISPTLTAPFESLVLDLDAIPAGCSLDQGGRRNP